MKQHITMSQFEELKKESREKLISWALKCKSWVEECNDGDYDPTILLLSIGQMIEFLTDNGFREKWMIFFTPDSNTQELCDDLWEAVKEVLNEK